VNQGTVIATQSTPLLISSPAGVTNTGTLRADGGTLQLQSTINSGGGNIEARNGSQVQLLNGAVINNANFSVTGAGSLITTVGGAQVTLGGGTVSGPMTMANNSFVRQSGDLVYNGTLNMASVGNFTDLQVDGLRTITGAATISMSNNAQNRLLAANGPGDRLTLGSGVTARCRAIGRQYGLGGGEQRHRDRHTVHAAADRDERWHHQQRRVARRRRHAAVPQRGGRKRRRHH
jgi:hypothetical protein